MSADRPELALDQTVDAALATLGVRGIEFTRPADLTIPHDPGELASDETLGLAPEGLDSRPAASPAGSTGPSRPGLALRSLGPASVSLGGLPAMSLARPPDGDAEADADLHIVSLLGEGGMGRVELARQRSLRREVAVKSLRKASAGNANALLREALFTGYLEHPNIVPVHQLGRLESGPILVMKRVDGVSWRELIADPEHAHWSHRTGDQLLRHLEILQQVCNAVEFAHSRGIVHRDIKPENVMLGEFGEVYLMDWGVAIDLEARGKPSKSLVGTPAYLAPEMLDGDTHVGSWTDVYLLGASLYEVLTGDVPHRGEGIRQTLVAAFQSNVGPFPEETPEELVDVVRAAMTREVDARRDAMPSAAAVRDAIADYLRHRAARELADRAEATLARAETALEHIDAGPDETRSPLDNHALRTILGEARFGFREALREWPESPEAERGLQRTLETHIRFELEARNHGLAESLCEELPSPRPALRRELDALAADLEADTRSRVALQELQHDTDVNVGARTRSWLILGSGSLVALLSILVEVARHTTSFEPTHASTLTSASVIGALLVGVVHASKSRVQQTRVNKQLATTLMALGLAVVLNRACAWMIGMSMPELIMGDLIVTACFVAMTAIIDERLRWLVPPATAGPFVVAALPDYAFAIEGIVFFVIAFDISWLWRVSATGEDTDESRAPSSS